MRYRNRYGRTRSYYADFEGVLRSCSARWPSRVRADEGALRGFHAEAMPCPVCAGARLKPEILAVTGWESRGARRQVHRRGV